MMIIDIKFVGLRSTDDLPGHVNDLKATTVNFIEIFCTAWLPKLWKKVKSLNTSVLVVVRAIRKCIIFFVAGQRMSCQVK